MANSQLTTVDFYGQPLIATQLNGKTYVAMKPICENIGLDWDAQRQRIRRHPVLNQGAVVITVPSAGGDQQTACLPLDMINGWLFSIDVYRVREDVQPRLIRYQLECFEVLSRHFMRPQEPSIPADLYARALQAEKDEAASKALAPVAGKALSLRRKEKKVLGEILVMLREEVQLELMPGYITE